MKYIMQCVEQRRHIFEEVKKEIPGLIGVFEDGRGAMTTFIRTMSITSEPRIHFEDDLVLTGGFLEKAQREIDKKPDDVIQFFSRRSDDLTVGSRYVSGSKFMANLAVYMPEGFSTEIVNYFHNEWKHTKQYVDNPTGLDTIIADYMKKNRIKYWNVVPNLVDHRVMQSAINPKRSKYRQSKTFGG